LVLITVVLDLWIHQLQYPIFLPQLPGLQSSLLSMSMLLSSSKCCILNNYSTLKLRNNQETPNPNASSFLMLVVLKERVFPQISVCHIYIKVNITAREM
jgi:hypothetical protein